MRTLVTAYCLLACVTLSMALVFGAGGKTTAPPHREPEPVENEPTAEVKAIETTAAPTKEVETDPTTQDIVTTEAEHITSPISEGPTQEEDTTATSNDDQTTPAPTPQEESTTAPSKWEGLLTSLSVTVEKVEDFNETSFTKSLAEWWVQFCEKNRDQCGFQAETTVEPEITTSHEVTEDITTEKEEVTTHEASVPTAEPQPEVTTAEALPTKEPAVEIQTARPKPEPRPEVRLFRRSLPTEDRLDVVVEIINKTVQEDQKTILLEIATKFSGWGRDGYIPTTTVQPVMKREETSISEAVKLPIKVLDDTAPGTSAPPAEEGHSSKIGVTITVIIVVVAMVIILVIGLVIALKRKQRNDGAFSMGSRSAGGEGSTYVGQKPLQQQSFDNAAYNKSSDTVRIGPFDRP